LPPDINNFTVYGAEVGHSHIEIAYGSYKNAELHLTINNEIGADYKYHQLCDKGDERINPFCRHVDSSAFHVHFINGCRFS